MVTNESQAGQVTAVKDDRPVETLSFAATNLVKPGLQSRRQQSEPPNNRNVFPPTPPPENDKQPAQMSRGMSVRNGGAKPVPSKLNLDRARPNDRYERNSPDELSRRPSRATSAAPTRSNTQRQAPRGRVEEEDEDAYPDLYDMYQGGGGSNGGGSRTSKAQKSNRGGQGRYIEEEEEGSDYEDASFDEGDFEMVSNRRAPGSVSGASRRSSSRRGPTKVRVKVHAGDVRYIMVGMAVEFPDLVSSIQAKFGLRRRFKIKVKDDDSDGDMITMGDQDDLDMIMQTVVETAKRQRLDTGKMEVSCPLLPFIAEQCANKLVRYGLKSNKPHPPGHHYTR